MELMDLPRLVYGLSGQSKHNTRTPYYMLL